MTAYLLVVGPDFDDTPTVQATIQAAYLALRPEAGQVILCTLGLDGAETVARSYWDTHGMPVHPNPRFGSKYVLLNHLLRTVVPDFVAVFGTTNVAVTAAERARLYGIRHTHIE